MTLTMAVNSLLLSGEMLVFECLLTKYVYVGSVCLIAAQWNIGKSYLSAFTIKTQTVEVQKTLKIVSKRRIWWNEGGRSVCSTLSPTRSKACCCCQPLTAIPACVCVSMLVCICVKCMTYFNGVLCLSFYCATQIILSASDEAPLSVSGEFPIDKYMYVYCCRYWRVRYLPLCNLVMIFQTSRQHRDDIR